MNILGGDSLGHHLIYQPPSSSTSTSDRRRSRSRSTSRHGSASGINIHDATTSQLQPPTIVALIDIDESHTNGPNLLVSPQQQQQQRSRRKSRSKLSVDETNNIVLPPPKQRRSRASTQLNIPTTLIVTDSDAHVIDNIDFQSNDHINDPASSSSQPLLLPSTPMPNAGAPLFATTSHSDHSNLDYYSNFKKRSDSKSSSIRGGDTTNSLHTNVDTMMMVVPNSSSSMMVGGDAANKMINPAGDYDCCCCCLVLLKKLFSCSQHKNKRPSIQLPTNNVGKKPQQQQQQTTVSNSTRFAHCCSLLRHYLVGTTVALVIASSIVLMNYLVRRTFNLKKLLRSYHGNSTTTTTTTSSRRNLLPFAADLAIETSATKFKMDCEYCYTLIWLVTSCLLLVYPVYVSVWLLRDACRRGRGNKNDNNVSGGGGENGVEKSSPRSIIAGGGGPNASLTRRLGDLFLSSLDIFKSSPQNAYKKIPLFDNNNNSSNNNGNVGSGNTNGSEKQTGANNNNNNKSQQQQRPYHKRNYYAKLGAITLLWLSSGYFYLRALDLLYCIDVVILFSINYSFIYMIKWIILHHKFIPLRLLGFILSIASLIFVFYSDGFSFNLKFLGNFCVTCSAIGSSILQIVWEINTSQKKNHQRVMFLSLIGCCSFVCGWPLVFLLEFSFVRKIPASLPFLTDFAKESIISLTIASLLGFVHLMLIKFNSVFTREVFVHIGSIIAIPIAFSIDMKLNNISLSSLKIGAFICVCIGYVFLIVPENLYTDLKKHLSLHEHSSNADMSTAGVSSSLTRRYQQNAAAAAAGRSHHHHHGAAAAASSSNTYHHHTASISSNTVNSINASGSINPTSPHHNLQSIFAGAGGGGGNASMVK